MRFLEGERSNVESLDLLAALLQFDMKAYEGPHTVDRLLMKRALLEFRILKWH